MRKLPPHPHRTGHELRTALVWEGIVYGYSEGLLLAALPVLVTWQMLSGVSEIPSGSAPLWAGAIAVGAALVVILVHHLGYAEFRAPAARPMLIGAFVTCGLQALAFLLTGNLLAPIVAHVLLHTQMLLRGIELPPHSPSEDPIVGDRSSAPATDANVP